MEICFELIQEASIRVPSSFSTTVGIIGALILGVARNPSLRGQLFSYAILGFAFSEATGLFALMMAFLLLYVA